MGKHAIGGMRSMMVPNRKADIRFRKKSYLRNKNTAERGNRNDQRRSNFVSHTDYRECKP